MAYTLEQCWHRVPGGTATAAIRVADLLERCDAVDLRAVAGRHRRAPAEPWSPTVAIAQLGLGRPWLYQSWLYLGRPRVEAATGPVDVCHATALIPAATRAPLVVTVHDLAFRRHPERFTRHGVAVMERALAVIRRRADAVLCPSRHSADDLLAAGIDAERIHLVPLGVDMRSCTEEQIAAVRRRYRLDGEFVLFVGTLEPRKNLPRLAEAMARLDRRVPLVVAGVAGWGEQHGGLHHRLVDELGVDIRIVGLVPDEQLTALYAAATVFAYPSEWEGFGLPVLEAMATGTPVVTSRGTSTEEVAGGAAVLVDPLDVDDLAAGLSAAFDTRRREELSHAGRERAASMSWQHTADTTLEVYRQVAR